VIISVNNRDLKLKPGMTANITVTVDRKDNVLSIRNTALRYIPPDVDPEEVRTLMRGTEGSGRRGSGRLTQAAPVESSDEPAVEGAQGSRMTRRLSGAAGEEAQAFRQREGEAGEETARHSRSNPAQRAGRDGGFRSGEGGRGTRSRNRRSFPNPDNSGGARFASINSRAAAPGQMWSAGEKIKFQDAPPMAPRPGLVWVLDADAVPEPRNVTLGITDGIRSELLLSDFQEGDQLIIGDSSQAADVQTQQNFNPFFGSRGMGRGRGRR